MHYDAQGFAAEVLMGQYEYTKYLHSQGQTWRTAHQFYGWKKIDRKKSLAWRLIFESNELNVNLEH